MQNFVSAVVGLVLKLEKPNVVQLNVGERPTESISNGVTGSAITMISWLIEPG